METDTLEAVMETDIHVGLQEYCWIFIALWGKQMYVCPDSQQPGRDLVPPCHDTQAALVEALATAGALKPQKRALW